MKDKNLNKLRKKSMHLMVYTFSLFFLCLISDFLGFKGIGQIFFYLCIISVFYAMFHTAIFVYHGNKEGVKRLKEGKPFFDESLLEDEDTNKKNDET